MFPDKRGYFGQFGGRFVPETLMSAIEALDLEYAKAKKDKGFKGEFDYYLRQYAGRPTPLYFAKNLSKACGGGRIYLKREDLCHTGSHKINNTMGQALLANRMKKGRIIAETGAGQHGVATATVAALFNFKCEVYMGQEDIERQALNVIRMKLLGARVIAVLSGSRTLKDATNEAMRDWVASSEYTHYIIGSVVGPHPYPMMVRDFQSVIGNEVRGQLKHIGEKEPDYLLACVGGGSNSIGLFYPFFDSRARFIGVEAGGLGINSQKHAATLSRGRVGILHGSKSYLLQDEFGQIKIAHSVSAGLDYPGVGPEHSFYKNKARASYVSVNDKQAIEGMRFLSETEGIIPALESAHAIAYLRKLKMKSGDVCVVCLSGRGDKDIDIIKDKIAF